VERGFSGYLLVICHAAAPGAVVSLHEVFRDCSPQVGQVTEFHLFLGVTFIRTRSLERISRPAARISSTSCFSWPQA